MSDLVVEAYVEPTMHQDVIDVSTIDDPHARIPGIRSVEMKLKVIGEPITGSYDDLFRPMAIGKTLIVTLATDSPWRELKNLRISLEAERMAVASLQRQLLQATCKHKFRKRVGEDEDSGGNMRGYIYYICSKCGKEKA